MKKMRFLLFALVSCALLATELGAGYLVSQGQSTYRLMAGRSHLVVKARLIGVSLTVLEGASAQQKLYASNNPYAGTRRDARLYVTDVLRNQSVIDVEADQLLEVISVQQRAFEQYPESLTDGGEGFFALRLRSDGLWEVSGVYRGMLTQEESADDLERLDEELRWVTDLYDRHGVTGANEPTELYAELQDRLMSQVVLDGSRLSLDSLNEFAWHFENYLEHFDDDEKAQLLSLLKDTTAGSAERERMLHAIGFIKPDGAPQVIVDLIASDASTATAAVGAWALEQYGRADGLDLLLSKFGEIEALMPYWDPEENFGEIAPEVSLARLLQALRLTVPQSYLPGEADARALTLNILRRYLKPGVDAGIFEQALLGARDLHCKDNELNTELVQLADDFENGLVDETAFRRVIVALAGTRTSASRSYLSGLIGSYEGRFDEHIEQCLKLNPFTILVDGQ